MRVSQGESKKGNCRRRSSSEASEKRRSVTSGRVSLIRLLILENDVAVFMLVLWLDLEDSSDTYSAWMIPGM